MNLTEFEVKDFFLVLEEGEGILVEEYVVCFLEGGEEPFFSVHVGFGTLHRSGAEEVDGECMTPVGSRIAKGIRACIKITGRLSTEDACLGIERESDGFVVVGKLAAVNEGELPDLVFVE